MVDELPSVLEAYRTIVQMLTGETPSALCSGIRLSFLRKLGLASCRIAHYNEERNEEGIRLHLDMLDEVRETAERMMARYQDLMAKCYNTKVKPRHFSIGDLVLRKVIMATKDLTQGKLGPNWEEPYKIVDCYRKGIYHLETLNGQMLHHP